MVDSNIAMQGQASNTGNIVRQANVDQQQNALSAEQLLKSQYENMNSREQMRLRSTVVGANQLKTYLERDDLDGAHEFLVNRQNALHNRMGMGEDVDDQETAYALQKLRSGDVDGLKNDVASIIAAGQAYGMIGGTGMPASIQEWQYYNSLSGDDQKRWLQNKRAGSNIDLGDRTIRLGADGNPEATYEKGVTPDNQPDNVRDKAAAQTVGTELGVNQAKMADIEAALPALMQVADKLSTLGQTATYSKSGVAKDNVARELGAITGTNTVPQGAVDRTEYMSTVDNEILPLLRQTFGAQFTVQEGESLRATLGDPNKSPQEKDAVLRAFIEAKVREVQTLARRTGQAPSAPSGQGAPAAGAPPVAGAIKVSNGQDTQWVMPENLPRAQAEGYQQVE